MAYRTAVPLTAEWLTKVYLVGVNLTDDDNNYYPPEIFATNIQSALSWAETEFGIHITKTARTARIDASGGTLLDYPPIILPDAKVQSVTSVRWKLGNSTQILEWPIDWFVIRGNQLQLVPAATGPSQEMTASYPLFALYAAKMGHSCIPGVWEVNYVAGFQTDGTLTTFSNTVASNAGSWTPSFCVWDTLTITLPAAAVAARTFTVYGYRLEDGKPFDGVGRLGKEYPCETVTIPIGSTTCTTVNSWSQVSRVTWTGWTQAPAINITFSGTKNDTSAIDIDYDLLNVIGMMAAIPVLNTAGDMVIGAGIAGKNASIDGLSAGIQTTASATNTAYGARVTELLREIKRLVPIIFRKYNGVQVSAW